MGRLHPQSIKPRRKPMLTHATTGTTLSPAAPAERHAVTDLMTVHEAPVSDSPVWAPEAAGLLLLGLALLLSPREPKK
jgi:hypothetical protein